MWHYNYTHQIELFHHGVKGMKWGIRRNTNDLTRSKMGTRSLSQKVSSRKTIRLDVKEYAHVMSELATNITREQRTHPTVTKAIGDYIYTFENHFDNTYRVIGKRKIPSVLIDNYERSNKK